MPLLSLSLLEGITEKKMLYTALTQGIMVKIQPEVKNGSNLMVKALLLQSIFK